MKKKDLVEEGKRLSAAGRYAAARSCFNKALAGPRSADALFELGKLYYITREFSLAGRTLRKALRCSGENGHITLLLGKVYKESGKKDRATEIFESMAKRGFPQSEVFRELGDLYRDRGSFIRAEKMYRKYIGREGYGRDILVRLADLLGQRGRYEKVVALYRDSGGREWKNGELAGKLAVAYREQGDYGTALRWLDTVSEGGGAEQWIAGERGMNYRLAGQLNQAAEEFTKALVYDPDRDTLHYELACIFRESGRYGEALEEFKKIKAKDVFKNLHREIAEMYVQQKRYQEALAAYRKAFRRKPPRVRTRRTKTMLQRPGRVINARGSGARPLQPGLVRETPGFPARPARRKNAGGSGARASRNAGRIQETREKYCRTIPRPNAKGPDQHPGLLAAAVRVHIKKGETRAAAAKLAAYLENSPGKNDAFFRNKMLGNIEFLQKKTVLASNPCKMAVCLTGKCNLRCTMCYIKDDTTMSWDLPDHTVREIIGVFPYLQDVQWRGGEVFLSRHFEELFMKAAAYPRLRQGITTNGLFINEKWARRLLGQGVKLDLSIDGVTRATYEHVRRGASFDTLLSSLELLAAYKKKYERTRRSSSGPVLHLTFVVMRSNIHEMEKVPDFAHRYGIDVVQFIPLTLFPPEELFHNENVQNYPDLVAYLDSLMPRLTNRARSLGIRVDNVLPFTKSYDFWDLKKKIRRDEHRDDPAGTEPGASGCCSPWNSLFIDFGGAVMSQCSKGCNMVIGNVLSESLPAIWNNRAMQKYRRNIVENRYQGACNPQCNPNIMPEDPTCLDLF